MTRVLILLLIAACIAQAQSSSKADLLRLSDELNTAIQSGDWPKAVKMSRALKTATEDARNHSMESAGKVQADSILAWFPADTETVVVAQQPFQVLLGEAKPTTAIEKPPSALDMRMGSFSRCWELLRRENWRRISPAAPSGWRQLGRAASVKSLKTTIAQVKQQRWG